MTYAVQVAVLIHSSDKSGDRLPLEQAFAEVAESDDVGPDTVKRAWAAHGARVMRNWKPDLTRLE
jgi:hypothetical protein